MWVERDPTPDQEAGMTWWASLSAPARFEWLRRCSSAATAWEDHKDGWTLDGRNDDAR